MITRRTALMSAAGAAVAAIATPALAEAPASKPSDIPLQRQQIDLVAPPFVHPHEQATRQSPKIMEVMLTIHEKKIVVDDAGTTLQAMTYNGSIPAPLIVVHEGDQSSSRLSTRAPIRFSTISTFTLRPAASAAEPSRT
jgi:nitrite reductase (NO-forming)